MIPIYKNTFYTFTATSLTYYITYGAEETVIYTGKAYKFPGDEATEGRIQINRIAQNYLTVELPRLSEISGTTTYTHPDACGTFKLYNAENDTLLATYDFVYDWDYDSELFSQNTALSVPINGKFAPGQFSLSTTYHTTKQVKTVIQRATPNDCGDYALYYRNRKGGFDSFLIEGKVRKSDDFTIYGYERSIDSNDLDYDRERVRYKNLISSKYELNTGWLNDAQAQKLARHLFSSGYVILHNLTTDQLIPVVITDTNVEYKTFNNDRKLISYQINVETANKEMVL